MITKFFISGRINFIRNNKDKVFFPVKTCPETYTINIHFFYKVLVVG
jgi:hypothetical protein